MRLEGNNKLETILEVSFAIYIMTSKSLRTSTVVFFPLRYSKTCIKIFIFIPYKYTYIYIYGLL